MKSIESRLLNRNGNVAPPVGAWIEIYRVSRTQEICYVAPPVGAWIEIQYVSVNVFEFMSRSSRRSVD